MERATEREENICEDTSQTRERRACDALLLQRIFFAFFSKFQFSPHGCINTLSFSYMDKVEITLPSMLGGQFSPHGGKNT